MSPSRDWAYHLIFHWLRASQTLSPLNDLRLSFVLATEHTLLRMFLNIWRQILFSGDLHDDAL